MQWKHVTHFDILGSRSVLFLLHPLPCRCFRTVPQVDLSCATMLFYNVRPLNADNITFAIDRGDGNGPVGGFNLEWPAEHTLDIFREAVITYLETEGDSFNRNVFRSQPIRAVRLVNNEVVRNANGVDYTILADSFSPLFSETRDVVLAHLTAIEPTATWVIVFTLPVAAAPADAPVLREIRRLIEDHLQGSGRL